MKVELKPHIGTHTKNQRPVDLHQDLVFLDGVHVGYVGCEPGMPVNFIQRLNATEKRAIVEHVTATRSTAPSHTSEPPAVVLKSKKAAG